MTTRGRGFLGVVGVRVEEDEEDEEVFSDVGAGAGVEVEVEEVADTGGCAAEVDAVDEEACMASEVEAEAVVVAEDVASSISESWSIIAGCNGDGPALSSIGVGACSGTSILI